MVIQVRLALVNCFMEKYYFVFQQKALLLRSFLEECLISRFLHRVCHVDDKLPAKINKTTKLI